MKIVNSWKPLPVFAKSYIVDLRLGSEYTSAVPIIQNKTKFEDAKELFISERYNNADLKISLYVRVHIKTIPWKFRIFYPKNSRVIYPWSLLFT